MQCCRSDKVNAVRRKVIAAGDRRVRPRPLLILRQVAGARRSLRVRIAAGAEHHPRLLAFAAVGHRAVPRLVRPAAARLAGADGADRVPVV